MVSEKSAEYGDKVYEAIKNAGIRTEIDKRNEKIGYMIREAQFVERVPYIVIIGAKEVETNTISVRERDTNQTITCTLDEFIARLKKETIERI